MANQELVPFTYAREAHNTLHDTNLPEHDGLLSQEQAARINDQFDIELYLGTHGLVGDSTSGNPQGFMQLSTQREYAEAASVVEGLQPGDMLFSEGYGFSEQSIKPLFPTLERGEGTETKRVLEEARHNCRISAWTYAQQLAILKGVDVVVADHDAFEKSTQQELNSQELLELMGSTNERDRALAKGVQTRREYAARNIVKDWALDHLQPENTPTHGGRKPKLALLFGSEHKAGLEEAFKDMGLDIKVNVLENTDTQGRAREQVDRMMQDMLASFFSANLEGTETPPSTSPTIPTEGPDDNKFAETRASEEPITLRPSGLAKVMRSFFRPR